MVIDYGTFRRAGSSDLEIQSRVPGDAGEGSQDRQADSGDSIREAYRRHLTAPAVSEEGLGGLHGWLRRGTGRYSRTGGRVRALRSGSSLKLLLDTHIWIWAAEGSEKLGRATKRHLENAKNELHLSPISIWEAHRLDKAGKVQFRPDLSAWLDEAFRKLPIQEAQLNFAVAREAAHLHLPQSDIGDLLLAATAAVHGLTLLTADRQLLESKWVRTLANA